MSTAVAKNMRLRHVLPTLAVVFGAVDRLMASRTGAAAAQGGSAPRRVVGGHGAAIVATERAAAAFPGAPTAVTPRKFELAEPARPRVLPGEGSTTPAPSLELAAGTDR